MNQLIIDSISKTYKNGIKALQDISLTIPKGMYGLLGPNGAGKSTLLRTLATLQEPDQGTVKLGGYDYKSDKLEIRKTLGYLPQQFGLYPRISAERLLDHLAVLKGHTQKKRRKELVNAMLYKANLYDVRKQNLGGFSGGMKQRFGIAQALLTKPKLLIVDEPTAGLDPAERNRFYNILSEISEDTIVILSSHIVDDIKELCNNMAVINQGKVLMTGRPLELISTLKNKVYSKEISREELSLYKQEYHVISEKLFFGNPIIHILSEKNPGSSFKLMEPSLEDVYFSQIESSLLN